MTEEPGIRVLVADDHPIVREGLRLVLERRTGIEVVAEAVDGRDAVTKAIHLRPDVALVDLDMPELDGIGVVEELKRSLPTCRCVVLTMHQDDAHLFAALSAGAAGYLVKGADADAIERAVRAAADGQILLGPEVAERITRTVVADPLTGPRRALPGLSDRDLQLLDGLAEGLDNAAIARRLGFAPKTIRNLVSELLAKIGAADRAAAVRIGRDAGLGDSRPR